MCWLDLDFVVEASFNQARFSYIEELWMSRILRY